MTCVALAMIPSACSERRVPEQPLSDRQIDVSLYAAAPLPSRTTLGPNWADTQWEENDRIAVWAESSDGIEMLGGVEFELYAFRETYSSAEFTASISAQTLDPHEQYTYRAIYPAPTSISGRKVTYRLPAEQDGAYRGEYDVLLAEPTRAAGLSRDNKGALQLHFVHKLHAMRIEVPSDRNLWKTEVHRLLIEFPTEVAGDLTFDIADPDAEPTLSDGSRTIDLKLARPLDETDGNYVWIFVKPGTLRGEIRFTAFDADGHRSQTLSQPVDKYCEANHVTPVQLTIPQELPVTWLDFSIAANHLGEPVQRITFTAPENASFRNGAKETTLQPDTSGHYRVGFYADLCGTAWQDGTIGLTYDSEHARIPGNQALGTLSLQNDNRYSLTVPYLLEADFSTLGRFDQSGSLGASGHDAATIDLDAYGYPGWTGNQIAGEAGKAIAIRHQNEKFALRGTYRGRLDSAPLQALKSNVKVSVSFSYSGRTSNKNFKPYINYGYTTKSGRIAGYYEGGSAAIKGGELIETVVGKDIAAPTDGSFDNLSQRVTFTIDDCSPNHRISWDCFSGNGTWLQQGTSQQWIFLDDIKVSISK